MKRCVSAISCRWRRCDGPMTGKPLHHFPTRRLCNLASLTSFYFHGDSYVGWGYSELAGQ